MPVDDIFEKRGGLFTRLQTEREAHEGGVSHQFRQKIDIFFAKGPESQTRSFQDHHRS